ncbi:unnamed protein product [Anisakis simplex]|uniref:Acetyl-CoA acetyltransferase, mitochondrial (inferred by orthology to a human protein) n=1 Tax=Anisakis simplex TaxID=6269 RepID=A0A0M3J0Q8_ANISI|nr:unnamed protein product [Anisakis simplex]
MNTIQLKEVYIVSAVRTPIASFRSTLTPLSAVDLGVVVTKEAIARSCIPKSAQCLTINKVCSSSMKAIMLGAQQIQLGQRQVVMATGTESMSNVPFYIPRGEIPYGGIQLTDGVQKDGLTDSLENEAMGLCAEKTVKEYGFTREQLDTYAIESYQRADRAWQEGLFNAEVVAVSVPQKRGAQSVVLSRDEEFKRLIASKVPALKPVFQKDGTGTITAANASSINDGASACLLVGEDLVKSKNLKPIAKIIAYAEAGLDPVDFTKAPSLAVHELLKKSGVRKDSIKQWEINEAFAVTALAFIEELQLDPKQVNVKGGAVALGHPLGSVVSLFF